MENIEEKKEEIAETAKVVEEPAKEKVSEVAEKPVKAEKPKTGKLKTEKPEKENPLAQKYDMGEGSEKMPSKKSKKAPKKKVCPYCTEKGRTIDYKEFQKLKRYITEKGKIIPRRSNGLCALHQREVTQAIKRARTMALLPFKAE